MKQLLGALFASLFLLMLVCSAVTAPVQPLIAVLGFCAANAFGLLIIAVGES